MFFKSRKKRYSVNVRGQVSAIDNAEIFYFSVACNLYERTAYCNCFYFKLLAT